MAEMTFTYWMLLGLVILFENVNAALNVYTSPGEVLKPAKSSVIIDCIPTPKDNVRIIWKHHKKQIPLYPATGIATEDTYMFGNHSLYIRLLRKRNTGKYTCIASSGAERIHAFTVVRVAYLQQFTPIAPVKAFENSAEAVIDCVAPRGVPKPEVTWKKESKAINSSRITSVPSTKSDVEGRKLIIKNVKLEDAGTYTCYAKNMVKERNVTTTLQVVIPGDVVVEDENGVVKDNDVIKENENSSFQCKSKSKPPLPVIWKKLEKTCKVKPCKYTEKPLQLNNRVRVVNGKLIIQNALPTDKGRYKCVAGLNSEFVSKNVTLNVVELIKIDNKLHQKIQRKDLRKSKDAKINCQFRGDGVYTVRWSKKNTKKLPSNMQGDKSTLSIKSLKLEDAGDYLCTAQGTFNTFTGSVLLEVYKSPEFVVRPKNVSGIVAESVWVHCSGKGTPTPSVNYLKSRSKKHKNRAILNETRFITLKNHTLYIKELKKEDDGAYFCWLTQQHSSVSSDFYLTVREPPKTTDSGTPMARTVGIAVGCAGVYILLVIGLMIYCRARRARLLKKEAEDGECLKDPLVGNEDIPLQNGKCLDQWEFPRENVREPITLGRGKMGRIFKAKIVGDNNDSSETVVVKEFDGKVEEYKNDFHLEVEMFSQLNHENVVRLIGVTTDSHPYYIITDFSELGDLKQFLNNAADLTNSARLNMSACIASGMDYLIKLHYIHRDLAGRNCIPYLNNSVKVSFLSICEDLYHDDYYLLNNIPVPLRWLSPEAIKLEAYSEKSDVWSFGVTIWEIFSGGKTPYTDYKNENVLDGVCKELRLPIPRGCPSTIYEVMKQCWVIDCNQRPTFEQLTSILAEIKISQ